MADDWGRLPAQVHTLIWKREWLHRGNWKARLLGERPFPLRISLKPPTSRAILADLTHFQHYVGAWRQFPQQQWLEWEVRSYRTLGNQRVPVALVLNDITSLLAYLGKEAQTRSDCWVRNMTPLLAIDNKLYPVLVNYLELLASLSLVDIQRLQQLIPQLKPGMGNGQYLRALPLQGVDTKFLEQYVRLISDLLDCLHDGAIAVQGGLAQWLDIKQSHKGWLTVRPLCAAAQAKLGGLALFQLTADELRQQPLPAKHILVVENVQSGLGLPLLADTIAVFGGGKNVGWLDAPWLADKDVAYWGDIDSWGLHVLSDARAKLPQLTALMMDHATVMRYSAMMVDEDASMMTVPTHLTADELALFEALIAKSYPGTRLEQEKLAPDYIQQQLSEWLGRLR
jgi:hypothetical protein